MGWQFLKSVKCWGFQKRMMERRKSLFGIRKLVASYAVILLASHAIFSHSDHGCRLQTQKSSMDSSMTFRIWCPHKGCRMVNPRLCRTVRPLFKNLRPRLKRLDRIWAWDSKSFQVELSVENISSLWYVNWQKTSTEGNRSSLTCVTYR